MRYVPQRPLPRYAFVPGRQPHPVRDPLGHSFGVPSSEIALLDVRHPGQSAEFLFAIDLFNLGYYWEAHEAWESLWNAAGRTGPVAVLLKGLIKLAAAGVKSREGNAAGVQRHARRAAELLRIGAANRDSLGNMFESINSGVLIEFCDRLATQPMTDETPSEAGRPVLGIQIVWTAPEADGPRPVGSPEQ